MVHSDKQSRFLIFVIIALMPAAMACGSGIRSQSARTRAVKNVKKAPVQAVAPAPPAATATTPPQTPSPVEDPVLTLIRTSEEHFQAGQKALELGHFDSAKQEFNRAVDLLIESPYGGRIEPRIREHFDKLIDRISAYEVKALAEGDGFTEKKYDTASIDDLLALSTTFEPPAPSAALKDVVASDLETGGHDIPIPLNERVLSYIALFQGRLHEFIEEGMKRGSKYLPMIQSAFRAEGLPLDLAYVPLVESAFKPNALSRTKAKGVWQFMAGTAAENGLRRNWYIDERSDPEKATLAAAKYLRTLGKLFDGDWHLALASYNGGPGRLQRAIKRVGVEDFWKLADRPKLLPRETREYVPMILAAIVIARNPAEYGFDFAPDPASSYERVTLNHAVDLRRIAEWCDTTITEIQTLNPELRRWTTPVKDSSYELKVPVGTSDVVKARLDGSPASDLVTLKWYTVRRSDTIATVARRLQVSRSDLAEANDLTIKSHLAPGQKLIVPHEVTALMAAQTVRGVPVAESRAMADPVQLSPATEPATRVRTVYRVHQGDTLSSIAELFRTTVAALKSWNPGLANRRLTAGSRLTVYKLAAN